jgi:copper chaperone NosL
MAARNVALGAAAVALAAGALWLWAGRAPEGPSPVAWDRVPCAHCHMLVSDPRFAAQLQLQDGEVLQFDDPGCLLLTRAELTKPVRAAWFHDSEGEGWLSEREVAFVRGATTPMGYGLAAVRAGIRPDALDPAAALAALRARP